MAGARSLVARQRAGFEDVTMAEVSVLGRLRSVGFALATVLAGAAVLLDELAFWAGQPTGDPTAATVSGWYDAHAGRVLLGDLLWLASCGVLVAALWTAVARFETVHRWAARAVGLAATTALAISSLLAARIAIGVGDDLRSWELEGTAYRAGTVLLALTLLPVADGLRRARRTWLLAPTVLVGFALAIPATSTLGLMAAFVLVAVVLGARTPREQAEVATSA